MEENMRTKQMQKLNQQKQKIIKQLPSLGEILRGTFIKCYLKCIRPNCKCHKGKKYEHGPYYRVSYGKGKRVHHIYVPLKDKKKVKTWVNNYNKIWQGIENISDINIRLIRAGANK